MVDKKIAIVCLIVILILGLYLRVYHLDYPVIGYHNTKESHTLGEGYMFLNDGEFLVNKEMYSVRESNIYGAHMDNFPLLSWINAGLWSITGPEVWVARLVIVLFSIGAILMTYFVLKEFFKKQGIALLGALFMSVMPLLVFFGRQVQYDMPALFFMLVGIYYFLRWRESPTAKNFIFTGIFLTLTALLKTTFLIIVLPLLVIFPFKEFFSKESIKTKYFKQILISLVFIAIIAGFLFYSSSLEKSFGNPASIEFFDPSKFSTVLTFDFWNVIYLFAVGENFTFLWLLFAFLGLGIAVLRIIKKRASLFDKFIVAYGLSYFLYILFSPPQMMGHNYYQVPYAPLVALSVAYFLFKCFDILRNIKIKFGEFELSYLPHITVFVLLLVSMIFVGSSIDRQFDTQFYGLDIAGDYIYKNSQPGEVIFESGHQDRGLAWHSKRRLAEFSTPENLKAGEENLNVSWVFIYQWGFNEILGKEDMRKYIFENYELKQLAFIETSGGNQPVYFLFKKGGSFDETQLNAMLQNKQLNSKEYQLTRGTVKLNYIDL